MMFVFRHDYITTTDIGLTAFLMINGASMEHVEHNGRIFTYTLMGKRIKKDFNDWMQGIPVMIAPRSFLKIREDMKKFRPPVMNYDTDDVGVRDELQIADKMNSDGTTSAKP